MGQDRVRIVIPEARDGNQTEVIRGGDRDREPTAPTTAAQQEQQPAPTAQQHADTNRRLDVIEERQNRQDQQIRLINDLGQATRAVIQAYLNVSATLQLAYVPFKTAYENQAGAMQRHTARLDAQRMAFIDLFFVGLGGAVGGVVQQGIRNLGPKDALRYVAAGTAAGDISKYMVRLIPGNGPRAPDAQPTRQADAPPPDRQPSNPQSQPAPGGAPQPANPQTAPQAGGQPAPASDPLSANLDPNSWLQSTLGHVGIASANVSAQLSELAGRVTGGMVSPDGENPVAFVNRLLVPIQQLRLDVHPIQHYSRVLWNQWLSQVWLEEATEYSDHDQHIVRLLAQDRSLLNDIEQQCGNRDLIRAAIERGQARVQANRRRRFPTAEDLIRRQQGGQGQGPR